MTLRREFLKLLSAAGFVAATPDLWRLDASGVYLPADDLADWMDAPDLAVGAPMTCNTTFMHNGPVDGPVAIVRLARPLVDGGDDLLSFGISPGGTIRWIAAPGEEIRGSVRLIVPEFVSAHVVGRNDAGKFVFATREASVPLAA